MRWKSRIAVSLPPWCDAGWNGRSVPLSGKTRADESRLILKENTRVTSDAKASACTSHISFMCSSNESGTPAGASGSALWSPDRFRSSTVWMRRSSSRTSCRYRSSLALSFGPSSRSSCAMRPVTQSRMLPLVRRRNSRSAAVPPAPKSCSKATRGSRIIGSGSVGDAQLMESVYTQV